ncbi:peptidoglycan-associated lipoprotein Pal [Hyphobacterium sp. CCMP332]|jgi:peptidoglycan-associated lipoprotein|uniref:peptidoglycan-associated lipoprotein Pal n=1 Tax=Hyphobacterium sp. CCMP332 TaxID=2749086 RepID=UPI0016501344|nr:peptidoglycan-associated lipoprotein Pal [Hyphobacterium sp. CCMP332]QNL17921.1 peptidoglycan-associated lipoprotein Pal [Hyphobacterium sp. CCMP332]
MKFKLLLIAGMTAVLAACASTPPQTTTEAPTSEPPRTTRTDTTGTVDPGPVPGTEAHFVATAGDRVFYDLDRSTLTAAGRETLRRQADWLNAYSGTNILIAGNCDERGTREYNLALGARRANAARDYLVSLGVSPSRIQTVSYGKERPTCRESGERCWSLNRNATTMITGGVTG